MSGSSIDIVDMMLISESSRNEARRMYTPNGNRLYSTDQGTNADFIYHSIGTNKTEGKSPKTSKTKLYVIMVLLIIVLIVVGIMFGIMTVSAANELRKNDKLLAAKVMQLQVQMKKLKVEIKAMDNTGDIDPDLYNMMY